MAAPDDGDRRNYYERRQDKQRPAGRRPGENRAEHRKRLRTEKRGNARESSDSVDEARAESSCSLGVGCGTSGACYAEHHGMPEQCGRKTHNAGGNAT